MVTEKRELRIHIRQLKQQLPDGLRLEKSEKIRSLLESDPDFIKAETVLIYWSMPDEVHTHDFINKWWKSKIILLPSVQGTVLKLKQFTGLDSLQKGELMGILEPVGPEFSTTEPIDLIVVPGIAFDKNNFRMGRGRGFYDRLLQNKPSKKIGICFDFQFFESIPKETHDIPMDAVIWA
ncbi:MAG: 5-formyltetrahydrofolate cyclo-ligase [Salinivirgaceae bacterium]|jgi:5-formyltetrahydrofolate cyclo-ligase